MIKMFKLDLAGLFSILFYLLHVHGDIILNNFKSDRWQCRDICTDSFFLLPVVEDSQLVCERGCRFFNLIYLSDDHEHNTSRDGCFVSCSEAYGTSMKSRGACVMGCNAALKRKENELTNVLALMEQDSSKNLIFMESEIEILESDILSDPLIKSQIESGYNLEYKIPETRIRTMPIEEIIEKKLIESRQKNSLDWLDCASKNSGIPKWILLAAILIAVLVALWLSISSEKKEVVFDELHENIYKNDNPEDEKRILDDTDDCTKDPNLFCDNKGLSSTLNDNEVNFSAPPKYTIETEKV